MASAAAYWDTFEFLQSLLIIVGDWFVCLLCVWQHKRCTDNLKGDILLICPVSTVALITDDGPLHIVHKAAEKDMRQC